MKLSAAVIAGGKSSRMGREKARLRIRGRGNLLERQLVVLKDLRPAELLLSCRPGQFPKRLPDIRQVWDNGDLGPIGGLAALLRSCRTEWLFVLAVDLPRISTATVRRVAGQAIFANGRGTIPLTQRGIEPLAAVYPIQMLDLANQQIRLGRDFSMRTLVENGIQSGLLNFYVASEAEQPRFFNWNRPFPV